MAYAQSRHIQALDAALQGIVANVQAGQSATFPVSVREYCIAAGIFLAHAEFENFFVDLLDSLARIYGGAGVNGVPARLKAHLFVMRSNLQGVFGFKAAGGSEHEFLDRAATSLSGPARTIVDPTLPFPALSGDDIHGEQSYPSEKNIKRILKRIGVGDPTSELNRAIRADAMALLQSLASLRTALAHSGSLPSISASDVAARIADLFRFAESFDRVIFKHLTASHSETVWHSNIV